MTINERLFYLMNKMNIKAIDIANHLNVTKSVISNWKNRGTNPPAEYIEPICELLEVKIEYLLTGKYSSTEELSENEKEMLDNFRMLPEREQIKFIGRIEDTAIRYRQPSEKSSESKTG